MKKVVIVGGGTAGWMTAASLAHQLGHLGLDITLVESSEIGTIGVGEATVPAIRDYFASLGLDTHTVMKATNGTVKLGIEFVGWAAEGRSFFHPFGQYGAPAGTTGFHHIWHRLRALGDVTPLAGYNLCTQLALAGRFTLPNSQPRAAFEAYDWAIHFDAGLFARFLRGFAEARGVMRIDARVVDVVLDPHSGLVDAIRLDNSATVTGELFIDCTGFRGLLIQGALKTGYEDWRRWLPCDRAVALPCTLAGEASPFTRSTAMTAGWTWRIPLQHRVGNGYVYSSDHIGDDEAEASLRAGLEGEVQAQANRIRFTTGHATRIWNGNCVAMGLAAGFLEPLESTSIVLIQTGIEKLIRLFPTQGIDTAVVHEYNRTSALEYERIRDFILLHYWASGRDEPLWETCRATELPETLRNKIEVFRGHGHLVRYEWESFQDPSWLSMYAGFGIDARARDPGADRFETAQLLDIARRMRADIASAVARASPHGDYVAGNCRSDA